MKRPLLLLMLLAPGAFAQNPPAELTPMEVIEKALSSNPHVLEAQSAADRGRIQTRISLSPFLPTLAVETGTVQRSPEDRNESGHYLFGAGRMNLFNGGLDWSQRRIQRLDEERNQRQLALRKSLVARESIRRITDLMLIDESIALKREALQLNQTQMRMAQQKVAGGITTAADVIEFEFRENALATELELLAHERNVASRALSKTMGLEPRDTLRIKGSLEPSLATLASAHGDTEGYLGESFTLDAAFDARAADIQLGVSRAVWLPKADLEARYGDQRFADPEVEGLPGWRLELRLTLPIFSGLETFYARQLAAVALQEAEARHRAARLVSSTVQKDRSEKLLTLNTLMRLQDENIKRAERYYRATVTEYRRGIKNSPDLSQATERLFDARLRKHSLTRDFVLTQIGLTEETRFETN
jgi:outer membrane protein